MAENSRGSEERRTDEGSGQVRKGNQQWHQFPNGFEGMNFEQKREPYRGGSAGRGNGSPEAGSADRRGGDR